VKANAVFYVDHSDVRKPLPVRISISGLHITVPAAVRMHGISVLGAEVTLNGLTIYGAPLTDVRIGAGAKGAGAMVGRIALTNSALSGGRQDVVSITGPLALRVEGNTFTGARGASAAGLHIRTGDRGQPVLDVRVTGNTVARNAGPGIFLDLTPANGLPILASGIELSRNVVLDNARKAPRDRRGGIVVAGGQSDGKGAVLLSDNFFRGNRGTSDGCTGVGECGARRHPVVADAARPQRRHDLPAAVAERRVLRNPRAVGVARLDDDHL
jgi:hypothetical protein